jgi:glycosyltransferase involved in cell wall biosynthesis
VRVLVLSNLYPPNAMGGYELSCRDVVERWRARGHEVGVLTTRGRVSGVAEPAVAEPHVRRQLQWYWHEHAFVRPSLRQRLALERANHQVLAAALAEVRPDVVSVWHMGGMPLSLLAALDGAPAVLNVCDEWPDYGPRADAWTAAWSRWPAPARRLGARLTGVPTQLVDLDGFPSSFVSQFTLDRLRDSTRWRFPRAEVVGSGVDTTDFPLLTGDPGREWRWRLLCVGRVEPRKGFADAVSALAELPEARLRIVGVADPAHLAELQALGGDRLVVQAAPRAALRETYADADVLLFPSTWEEPFGLVPLEAMSQGVPVVATRRGGSAEFLVDGVNCLEVPAHDPAAVAVAVRRLSADQDLRQALVAGGLRTASTHTVDRLAEALEDLHQRASS